MRRDILASDEIYHLYNRGVDKRNIFLDDSYYSRFFSVLNHYLKYDYPYSHLRIRKRNNNDLQSLALKLEMYKWEHPPVEILSLCLLPNHFHLQVKQLAEDGITTFMHRIGTSYTNYFNIRLERSGRLFQGPFKSVRVENEGQFLCLNRYIHVNPLAAGLVTRKNLTLWKWSSLPVYLGKRKDTIFNTKTVLSCFKDVDDYLDFVLADFPALGDRVLEGVSIDDDFGWFKDLEEEKKRLRRELLDSFERGKPTFRASL